MLKKVKIMKIEDISFYKYGESLPEECRLSQITMDSLKWTGEIGSCRLSLTDNMMLLLYTSQVIDIATNEQSNK